MRGSFWNQKTKTVLFDADLWNVVSTNVQCLFCPIKSTQHIQKVQISYLYTFICFCIQLQTYIYIHLKMYFSSEKFGRFKAVEAKKKVDGAQFRLLL